jgi:hypothetical protein
LLTFFIHLFTKQVETMRYLLLLPLLASAWLCHAQQLTNSTGKSLTGGTFSVDYSVGEIATFTLSGNQSVVTQGGLQPDISAPPGCNTLVINQVGNHLLHPAEQSVFHDNTGKADQKERTLEMQPGPAAAAPENAFNYSVFPNPATDVLNLDLVVQAAMPLTVQLLTQDGKIVQEIFSGTAENGANHWSANVQGLPSGMYLLQIKAEQVFISKKVLLFR